jgi:chemotaxis protein CheC
MTESMTKENTINPESGADLEIFLELGNIGAGHAATSLSEIFQEPISIEVPKIHTIPRNLVPGFYKKHDTQMTAIYMQLRGEAPCEILLMFEVEEARKIAAMMNMCSVEELDPEMEASAIEELGNIVIGSFLAALSDFTDVNLVPNPPQKSTDTFDALLDVFLVNQLLSSELAVIFDTQFKRSDGNISGVLMMFPSQDLQDQLTAKAKDWMG